jgi:hypothetical protein
MAVNVCSKLYEKRLAHTYFDKKNKVSGILLNC